VTDNVCACGHVEDEHEGSGFFSKCLVEECDCIDFELDEDAEEEA
jgi:hypothetical protein